jgi:hypothetical protein
VQFGVRRLDAALLTDGLWSLVFGLWSLVFGLWSLVFGLWSLVFGLWSLVFGNMRPGTPIPQTKFKTKIQRPKAQDQRP